MPLKLLLEFAAYPKEIITPYKNNRLLLQTKGCILHLPWWNWASCNVSIYTLLWSVPLIHSFEVYERATLKHDFVNSSPAMGGCSLFHWDNVEVGSAILGNLRAYSFTPQKRTGVTRIRNPQRSQHRSDLHSHCTSLNTTKHQNTGNRPKRPGP
jgi:hypothetical protein